MSSNNVVWVMSYKGYLHVFYSGCIDNEPTEPDIDDEYYKMFGDRSKALTYAHDVVKKINKESYAEGFADVEYGVCELDYPEEVKDKPHMIPTAFGTPEELKKSHEELKEIAKTFTNPDIFYCEICQVIHRSGCKKPQRQLDMIDDAIDEWKQKIKDLQFSIDQFEQWKKELLK